MFDVLLDMDGVLVDNIQFEQAVTSGIVARLADHQQIDTEQAHSVWVDQLRRDLDSPRWYDYDFHCQQLGIPHVAREIHQENARLLKLVPSADATLAYLNSDDQFKTWIASDAMRWVVEFKLKVVGLRAPDLKILSSDVAQYSKSSAGYWANLGSHGIGESDLIYIDNRADNLLTCLSALPDTRAIHFEFDEHVSALPHGPAFRNLARSSGTLALASAIDHTDLLRELNDIGSGSKNP